MSKIIRLFFICFIIIQGTSDASNSKRVFLTGAAGFIGSNFLQYMFDAYPDYRFIVLDNLTYAGSLDNIPLYIQQSERFKFVQGSVVNFSLVDSVMKDSDFVVHFAAETHVTKSISDDYIFFETDVLGTRAMMASLVKHSDTVQRFIHISTSEVYGTAEYLPMDEIHPLNPRSPYAAAKAAADRLVYAYSCTYNLPVTIVRPFNNYGARQHLEKMIPRFITACIKGEQITIHGNGRQTRDWIHTSDVCAALDIILHLEDYAQIKNQEINIGTGCSTSVLEIAQNILNHFNLPASQIKFIGDRPGQVDCHLAAIEKAKKLLDWTPSIDIHSGLESTIQWYINHPEWWTKREDHAVTLITTKDGSPELH